MREKIVSVEELARRTEALRGAGKTVVFTNGCFDLLHVGHVRYLEKARRFGDALVVGVNGDSSVRELKGSGRPVNNERDRAEVLAGLACVDLVAIFPEKRATRILERARPSIYVKGGDYTKESLDAGERDALQKMGTEIQIIPFESGYSTSGLLEKLGHEQK